MARFFRFGQFLGSCSWYTACFHEPSLDGKKVVQFDGLSQLYSTYDFGSVLSEYSIFALARHTGDRNGTIIGSVGTDWVFGFGNGSSAYWKMGSFETRQVRRIKNGIFSRAHSEVTGILHYGVIR